MLFHLYKIQKAFLLTVTFTCIILSILYIQNVSLNLHHRSPITKTDRNQNKYPGSFVHHLNPHPSNASYCKFNYGYPEAFVLSDWDYKEPPEMGAKSEFRVIYNVIEAVDGHAKPAVTYATHITVDFTNYIAELVRFYDGPISVAAFAPSSDASIILEILHQLCHCLPDMSRVSVHFVVSNRMPMRVKTPAKLPKTCLLSDSEKIRSIRQQNNSLTYAINVCRNVARTKARTKYVLVSDIQLLPSEDLSSKFMKMLHTYQIEDGQKMVFVVPVFEVEHYLEVPTSKSVLLDYIRTGQAVYFHKLVCTHCQKFPGLDKWLERDSTDIEPLLTAKREVPYQRWEPIYIGTNAEPLYNEVLSWEGLQDKMLQMLELCLLDYKFVILDGAFLVHWPGMKKSKNYDEAWRQPFTVENTRQYKLILKEFLHKYKNRPQCKAVK